jgi:hypothetical protein
VARKLRKTLADSRQCFLGPTHATDLTSLKEPTAMMHPHRLRLCIEQLEDRCCPTVSAMVDTAGNVNITGAPDGLVNINLTNDATYAITDNGVAVPITGAPTGQAPGAVIAILSYSTSSFESAPGNDTITVNLNGFRMGGGLGVNMGKGLDTLNVNGNAVLGGTVPANIIGLGVNTLLVQNANVGGTIKIDSSRETQPGDFRLVNDVINGDVNIKSSNDRDNVTVDNTTIGRDLLLSLSDTTGGSANALTLTSTSTVGRNLVFLSGAGGGTAVLDGTISGSATLNMGFGLDSVSLTGSIGSNLTLLAGHGVNLVTLDAASFVGGNVFMNLNNGLNFVDFEGSIGGTSLTYMGGSGVDNVTFNAFAPQVRATALLGANNDSFILGANTSLAALLVDFGSHTLGGMNSFTNLLGVHPFPITLRNLF